jgi:hypothetical protein
MRDFRGIESPSLDCVFGSQSPRRLRIIARVMNGIDNFIDSPPSLGRLGAPTDNPDERKTQRPNPCELRAANPVTLGRAAGKSIIPHGDRQRRFCPLARTVDARTILVPIKARIRDQSCSPQRSARRLCRALGCLAEGTGLSANESDAASESLPKRRPGPSPLS